MSDENELDSYVNGVEDMAKKIYDQVWDKIKELEQKLDLFVETEDYSVDIGRIYKRIEVLEKKDRNREFELDRLEHGWNEEISELRTKMGDTFISEKAYMIEQITELKEQFDEHLHSEYVLREVLRELYQMCYQKGIVPETIRDMNLKKLKGEISVDIGRSSGSTPKVKVGTESTDSKLESKEENFMRKIFAAPSHIEKMTHITTCPKCRARVEIVCSEYRINPIEVEKEEFKWLISQLIRNVLTNSDIGRKVREMKEKYLSDKKEEHDDIQ